ILPAGPDEPQKILSGVESKAHGREIEQAHGALERVNGAKCAVDMPRRIGGALDREKSIRGLLDQLPRLDDEVLEQVIHGAPPPAADRRSHPRNGTVRSASRSGSSIQYGQGKRILPDSG